MKFVMEKDGKRYSLSDKPDKDGGLVFEDADGNRDAEVSDDATAYLMNWRVAHYGEYDPSGLIDIMIAYAHAINAQIIWTENDEEEDEGVDENGEKLPRVY